MILIDSSNLFNKMFGKLPISTQDMSEIHFNISKSKATHLNDYHATQVANALKEMQRINQHRKNYQIMPMTDSETQIAFSRKPNRRTGKEISLQQQIESCSPRFITFRKQLGTACTRAREQRKIITGNKMLKSSRSWDRTNSFARRASWSQSRSNIPINFDVTNNCRA